MNRETRSISLDRFELPELPPVPSPEQPLTRTGMCAESLPLLVRGVYVLCYREHQNKPEYGTVPIPEWDGGITQFGSVRGNIWPRVAAHIVQVGAEPMNFIRAQFWASRDGKPPPPNYLLSVPAVAHYEQFVHGASERAVKDLAADRLSIDRSYRASMAGLQWEYRRALEYALYDVTQVHASALFRYCLAVSEGLPAVAEQFYNTALMQYVFQREIYNSVWGNLLPAAFRQQGDDLYARIVGRS